MSASRSRKNNKFSPKDGWHFAAVFAGREFLCRSFSGKLERSDTAIAKCDQFCSLKIRGEIINIPSTPTGKSALNCQTSKTRGEIINSCYSGWEISDFDAKHPIKVQIIMSDTRIICFRKSLQNEFPTTNLFCGLQRAATT